MVAQEVDSGEIELRLADSAFALLENLCTKKGKINNRNKRKKGGEE